jgi:hypothetical protein
MDFPRKVEARPILDDATLALATRWTNHTRIAIFPLNQVGVRQATGLPAWMSRLRLIIDHSLGSHIRGISDGEEARSKAISIH